MSDIIVGVDQTDHIAFFCPHCTGVLAVTSVKTNKVTIDTRTKAKDKCTWIDLYCFACKSPRGWRKFYWSSETGEHCTNRTEP